MWFSFFKNCFKSSKLLKLRISFELLIVKLFITVDNISIIVRFEFFIKDDYIEQLIKEALLNLHPSKIILESKSFLKVLFTILQFVNEQL
jgi:hypothetical protein